MKRLLAFLLSMLGVVCVTRARDTITNTSPADRNVAAEFSASPAETITLFQPAAGTVFFPGESMTPARTAMSSTESGEAEPTPAPAPDPRFLYGGRDDFRWQLAIGADWIRFRSSIFNASAVGVKTSITYFTNDWFGIEGNIATGFAPEIFQKEHVKVLVYGGGPKIAWRERRWEPWAHAIFGGAHEQPQTSGHSKSAFAIEMGGGADYRFNPRFSGRLEADWVRTSFFSQSQNNFELMGGVVFHF